MTFIEVEYHGVTPIGPEMFPCILLRWAQQDRVLPLWIATSSADELDIRDAGHEPRRPTAHDLLAAMFLAKGGVEEVRILSHHQGVFIASILAADGEEVDARASDAILLARLLDVPIKVDEDVLAATALYVSQGDLARYFDLVIDAAPSEDLNVNMQVDTEFEELMRSLGVSEDDLRGEG